MSNPDWLSGEQERIAELGLETCNGSYFNAMLLPFEFNIDMNVKRCETSFVDWATGQGKEGPGLNINCYYEPSNFMSIEKPLVWPGFTYKYAYFENCYDTSWRYWSQKVIDDDKPKYNPKYGY